MSKQSILVVEDEADIRDIIAYNLERESFEVYNAEDGEAGLNQIRMRRPDLVLLDLMLPGIDGLEVCRRVRSETELAHIPIIMITAKGEESDVVVGLGMGADDYVVKPFRPRELVARVKAVIRRGRPPEEGPNKERITLDGMVIDLSRHKVEIDGTEANLTATEFRLFYFLASHPGRVYTRSQLMDEVIGDGAIVIDRNIDVHVRAVRKKIGDYRDYIETVRGVGYRFRDHAG